MQGKKLLLAVIGGVAAISIGTSAQALEMSAPCGWYVELNAGSARISNINFSGLSTSSSGIGGNANVGYKFMPYAALELGYTKYPDTKLNLLDGTNIGTMTHYSYDIAGKGIVPISDSGFEVFAKLGAQHIQSRVQNSDSVEGIDVNGSHSSTGIYLGLGGQVNIMPEIGVVVQWQRAQGSSSSGTEDLISVGVAFTFI